MKSIIQEASSLSKAIEQGWQKAGKPSMFSVKILQEASKNFIGLTTQNAKIAFYFGRFDELQSQPSNSQSQQGQQNKQAQQGQQRTGFSQQGSSRQGQQQRPQRRFYRRPPRAQTTNRPQQTQQVPPRPLQQQSVTQQPTQPPKDKPQ